MDDWHVDFINSYFEKVHPSKVRCEVTAAKGRILMSSADFRQGDVIFEERPLHIVTAAEKDSAYKIIKKLCSKDPDTFYQDALWYWAAVCSLTSADVGEACAAKYSLPTISADTQKKILCLYHEPIHKASGEAEGLVKALGLAAAPVLVDELLRAWILNCFDHSEKPQGYASYFGASFMSHSCHPNAIWHFAEGTAQEDTFVLLARRDIAPGDELCISYLPEQGLLHAAAARKTELRSSKSFTCTCERCGPGASEPDRCRGYRCPSCGQCSVFHPGPLKGLTLATAACDNCEAVVGAEEARCLLDAESELERHLKALDEQVEKRLIAKFLKEPEAQHMLRLVGDGASGSVGPQHWLCDRLWAHLASWYDETGRSQDACRMHRLRTEYQRKAYTSIHGELAWTLEGHADMLLRHAGALPGSRRLAGLDDAGAKRGAGAALSMLEEGTSILRKMFGGTHSYFNVLERKKEHVATYLSTGRWPAGKRKRAAAIGDE